MTVSKQIFRVLPTAFAVLAFSIAPTQAKKPDNPGGGNGGGPGQNGGGVIYFRYDREIYTMNDDGSDMTVVAGYPDASASGGLPSRQLHGGKRWFPFASGQELLGLSDAGDVVSLYNDPQLEGWANVSWQVGDEAISWAGRRRDDTGAVVEGGIYTTPVTFDGAGNIGSAGATELLVSLPLVDDGYGSLAPDVFSFDWSPDGTQFVYDTRSSEIIIADLSTGTFDTVASDMGRPHWSPAGDKLMVRYRARRGRDAVGVMNLDGSDMKLIASDGISWQSVPGVWSPTGSHLAFLHSDRFLTDDYIVRSTVDGKDKTRLTDSSVADGLLGLWPLGWREAPAAASARFASVPEPSTATILVVGLLTMLGVWRR